MLELIWSFVIGRLIQRSGSLFARSIWLLAGAVGNNCFEDPVYKRNVQKLIERNRQFEEARNEPHS
jgi:hypothetical protein